MNGILSYTGTGPHVFSPSPSDNPLRDLAIEFLFDGDFELVLELLAWLFGAL